MAHLQVPASPDAADRDYSRTSLDETYAARTASRAKLSSPTIVDRLCSPTPTQNAPNSPTSPTYASSLRGDSSSPRRSRQSDGLGTPFSIPRSALVFSPIANSSRSSLESAGSSYHSWEGALNKSHGLFHDLENRQPPWHDLSSTDKSSPATSDEMCDAEEIIRRYAGLTKNDFVAIQEKLVEAALPKAVLPPARERAPSLRRKRPSTSQSNYSISGIDVKVDLKFLWDSSILTIWFLFFSRHPAQRALKIDRGNLPAR
jgi:hypothetical protein